MTDNRIVPLLADGNSSNPSPGPEKSRCRPIACVAGALLLMFLFANRVFILHARGYQWSYFVWCNVAPLFASCPPTGLEVPAGGCDLGRTNAGKLLLTADGLSSRHSQRQFQDIIADISDTNNASTVTVLYILDAAYMVHYDAVPGYERSPGEYCYMRVGELRALGADEVVCLILSPEARAHAAENLSAEFPSFVENLQDIHDDDILELLDGASVVFVEGGNSFFLLASLRRKLQLDRLKDYYSDISFGDRVRDRVFDNTLAYVGVSAGSIVAGDDVRPAMPCSHSDLLQGNWSGLRLSPGCSFQPHAKAYLGGDLNNVRQLAQSLHTTIMGIPECQPIVENDRGHFDYICP